MGGFIYTERGLELINKAHAMRVSTHSGTAAYGQRFFVRRATRGVLVTERRARRAI